MSLVLLQDTHTLDLSEFRAGHTNITLLRLVNPEDNIVQRVVKFWADKEEYYNRKLAVTADSVRVGIRHCDQSATCCTRLCLTHCAALF